MDIRMPRVNDHITKHIDADKLIQTLSDILK